MAYPGVFMVDDATIFKALLRTRENGGLICMHAENGGVIDTLVKEALKRGQKAPKYHALTRPTRAEGEATGRAIALAEMAGVPIYIVHLSCSDALEKVKQARDMGLPAYAETCPQYLFLSYDDYERPGFEGAKYVMSPPLREKWNQDVLWKGLHKNDLQVVSTDHCPFCMNERGAEAAGQGRLLEDPERRARASRRACCLHLGRRRAHGPHRRAPLRRAGLDQPGQDVRPVAEEGHDRGRLRRRPRAVDPDKELTLSAATHHMQVDYNPYEGRVVKGAPGGGALARRGHRGPRRRSRAAPAAASSSSASPVAPWFHDTRQIAAMARKPQRHRGTENDSGASVYAAYPSTGGPRLEGPHDPLCLCALVSLR